MTDIFDDTRSRNEPAGVRTGQVDRVAGRRGSFERTRSHRVVRRDDPLPPPTMAMTFDDLAPHEDDPWGELEHWVEPIEERAVPFVGVDPRVVRIGAVALAGVLMIPLALALREDADEGLRSETLAATDSTIVTTTAEAPTTVLTVPVTAAAIAPVAAAAPVTAAATAPPTASRAPAGQAVAVAAPVCAGRYTVIFNDYWNRFPKTSGASVEEWLEANDATHDTPLYVGDELCIPPGAQAPAPPPPPTTEPPVATAAPTTQAPAPTQAPATTAAPVVTPPPPTAATAGIQPAAPTPTPAPRPPIAVDRAGAEMIIREVWPDELEERAMTIAWRESSLRPEVYNGTCCYGLFQIHFEANRTFLATLGITSPDQLRDARTNAAAAYAMYQRSGWAPWRTTDPG